MDGKVEAFELRDFFEIIKNRWIIIVLITLIVTIATGVASFYFITPIYQAKTEILVNKETVKDSINNQEIQANITLINTYSEVIKSARILDLVGSELQLSENEKASLGKKIKVSSVKNSQVISITVQDSSQKKATLIANTLAKTFKNQIFDIMKIDNVQILAEAKDNPNASPVKPNKKLYIAMALVVGLMISIGIALLLEFIDNTIKNEKDIEKVLQLPILGSVPHIQESKKKRKNRKKRPYEELTATRERRA